MLRKILGSNRAKIMGDRKNSVTKSFIIFTLCNIFRSMRMKWVGHVACVEGKKCIVQGSGGKT